jgi:hypothetical protein
MPDQILFANNALSTLAQPITVSTTVLLLQTGTGELFPSPGAGEYFKLTLEDRRTQQIEITHCIGRSGDNLTVVRAREDTSAQVFLSGATVSNRMTRDTPDAILAQVPNPNPWYLGPFALAPTTDNDGDPLTAGQQYFNSSDTTLYVYTGASWLAMNAAQLTYSSGIVGVYAISALAAFDGVTTAFSIDYVDYLAVTRAVSTTIAEQLLIFIDNVQQKPGTDFTLSALGTIAFTVAPPADTQFWGLWVASMEGPGRVMLTENRTYYVRPDGNDDNSGLADTAGGAWATLQYAYNKIATTLDMNGYTVTVQMADGTYAGGINHATDAPSIVNGPIYIRGNIASPQNVVVNDGLSFASLNGRTVVAISGVTCQYIISDRSSYVLVGTSPDKLEDGAVRLTDTEGDLIAVVNGGDGELHGALYFTATTLVDVISVRAARLSYVNLNGVTFENPLTLTGSFLALYRNAEVNDLQSFGGITGSITGKRISASGRSVLITANGLQTVVPGSTNGTIDATSVLL